MASISENQSGVNAPPQFPQAQQPHGAVVFEVPPGSGPEPSRLPNICNIEWQREGMPDTEFNRKYPPDPWGEEAAPNARVWKVYRDHQTSSDRGMLDSWNKTLDVLLIFAGLFSAVSTAFLIESYKALQPDYTQYIAVFLYASAVSYNSTGGGLPELDSIVAPAHFNQTSAVQRWTNGLWFSSLVISLAVALLCILIKQWLDEYNSHVSSATPSAIYWARRHCMYHRGLKRWGVPVLISFLPLLLHMSLFLFFGGLVLFLLPLDDTIAYSLLVMVSSIVAFYGCSLVLPAWRIECPSHTPLLTQAFLTASRGRSCLISLVGLLQQLFDAIPVRPCGFNMYRVIITLRTMANLAAYCLRPIRTRSSERLMRETDFIAKWALDLDGHILGSLINLPSDPNWAIVHAACGAIGAVTSPRTIEVIFQKIPWAAFTDILKYGYKQITSRGTGFWITAHGQLRRAEHALAVHATFPVFSWDPLYVPGLYSPLGIDGLLLQTMGYEDGEGRDFNINGLCRSLQSLLEAEDSSDRFPLRSTCLRFLERYASSPLENPMFQSCFLLVFCAGRFTSADMQELVRALRCVETVLRMQCSIILSAYKRGDSDYVCAVVDGLLLMLADPERYRLETRTAQTLAHHAYQCYEKAGFIPFWDAGWAHLPGLSAFARSPAFVQCVATRDSLANYTHLFQFPRLTECSDVQIGEYWVCIATLLKQSWSRVPSDEAVYLSNSDNLFPVERTNWRLREMLAKRGPCATRDDWYEPVLSAFLDGPNAIATWTIATSPDLDISCILELASLARRISIVLCRRARLGRANGTFIHGLFSGSFLFERFRDLVSEEHSPTPRWEMSFEDIAFDLAKHCLKLSPAALLDICARLEQTGDAGSELRVRSSAFAERIRDGSAGGGELARECGACCPCMVDSASTVPRRRTR